MPENNPLVKYKKERHYSWADLVKKTGINSTTLINICKMEAKDMVYLRLETVARLKKTIGIDLVAFYLTLFNA